MNAQLKPQSLKTLARAVHADVSFGARSKPTDDWQREAHGYTVCLRYQRRRLTIDFWCGSAITDEPTAEDVLECLLSDARSADEPFESWCADYAYDVDSRRAERIYKAVEKQAQGLRRLLGADFDTFLYAARN